MLCCLGQLTDALPISRGGDILFCSFEHSDQQCAIPVRQGLSWKDQPASVKSDFEMQDAHALVLGNQTAVPWWMVNVPIMLEKSWPRWILAKKRASFTVSLNARLQAFLSFHIGSLRRKGAFNGFPARKRIFRQCRKVCDSSKQMHHQGTGSEIYLLRLLHSWQTNLSVQQRPVLDLFRAWPSCISAHGAS